MSTTTTTPAVYVGTYHKYNCGSIFGKWFDLTEFDGREDFYEACQALHADEWDAEFMFQDWEGIPSQFVSESSIDWDFIAAYTGTGGCASSVFIPQRTTSAPQILCCVLPLWMVRPGFFSVYYCAVGTVCSWESRVQV